MPMGLVTDEEYEAELQESVVKRSEIESHTPKKGREEGVPNIPDSLRKIIGEESLLNGRQSALGLASEFGVSPSSVSAYAHGATSTKTYDTPSKSIFDHLNKSRVRATRRATKTLNGALSAITQEKLDYSDAKDLSSIAKDMSVIIRNLEPQHEAERSDGKQQPQFVIFAPQFRAESSFDVIDVKE